MKHFWHVCGNQIVYYHTFTLKFWLTDNGLSKLIYLANKQCISCVSFLLVFLAPQKKKKKRKAEQKIEHLPVHIIQLAQYVLLKRSYHSQFPLKFKQVMFKCVGTQTDLECVGILLPVCPLHRVCFFLNNNEFTQ